MGRIGKFEWKIILALLLTAVAPLVGTYFLVDELVEDSMLVGVNERVLSGLRAGVDLYKEVIESRMRIVRLQGQHLASNLAFRQALRQGDRTGVRTTLEDLVAGTDWISAARVLFGERVWLEVESPAEFSADRWRFKNDGWNVSDEYRIELTFVIGKDFLAASDDLRELVLTLKDFRDNFRPWMLAYYRAFLVFYLVILIAAVILGVLLSRSVTRRVAKLVEATKRAAQGDLDVRVGVESSDEIGSLAASFNQMMNDIQRGRDRIVYLEKVSSWQEIARRMAHEIKNPLTPIQLAVQELHRSYGGEDPAFASKLGDSLEIVEEEVGSLRRMVETFSEFARMPEVQPQDTDLNSFVSSYLKHNPQYAGRVSFHRADEPVPVQLDRVMMGRVLTNLIDNGLEAGREEEPVELAIRRNDDWGELTISDRGSGLSQEARGRLFQPYFTTKADGSGLGLAIVKKIVLQHGGEIFAASGVESGTVFTVRLRLDDRPHRVVDDEW